MTKKRRQKKKASTPRAFAFEASDRIGAAGAEDDADFLESCFVDTGNLELLLDAKDNRHIILGRTGSGKSALIKKLEEERGEHCITISPQSLALSYVSNSTVLKYFSGLGVNLDPFFKLLWRHVVTVEILSHHFDRATGGTKSKQGLMDWVRGFLNSDSRDDKRVRESLKYLEEWGTQFWNETEYRVIEITEKVESDLTTEAKGRFGIDLAGASAGSKAQDSLSAEQRGELKRHGQQIISRAQVQDLNNVLLALDKVLDDPQQPYFVVIDALDEDWVEERLKYKLIMALIQTARDFNSVENAKVILALRRDVIERVFRLARDSGFQEEKYESMYLKVTWSDSDLLEILETRLSELARRKRVFDGVSLSKVLPRSFRSMPVRDYIVSRAPRPRDIISFFNCCIDSAVGKPKLRTAELRIAEGEYSRKRLRALGDEWSADYPHALSFAQILRERPSSFKISSIDEKDFEEKCLELAAEHPDSRDDLVKISIRVVDEILKPREAIIDVVQILYRIGLVGLKVHATERESWSDELGRSVSRGDIDEETSVVVHPAYHRALGIREK
ncbi:MAG: P-loop NTPase fold protein [Pseudomonadota bacterium]